MPGKQSDIIWYFTDKPFISMPTVFNSLNWADRRPVVDTGGVGEIPGSARRWRNGSYPFDSVLPTADGPYGSPESYLEGSLMRLTPRPIWPGGTCSCCVPCARFVVTPQQLDFVLTGFVAADGTPSTVNGPWHLVRDLSDPAETCSWSADDGTWFLNFVSLAGDNRLSVSGTVGGVDYFALFEGSGGIPPFGPTDSITLAAFAIVAGFLSTPGGLTGIQANPCVGPAGDPLLTEGLVPLLTEGGDELFA